MIHSAHFDVVEYIQQHRVALLHNFHHVVMASFVQLVERWVLDAAVVAQLVVEQHFVVGVANELAHDGREDSHVLVAQSHDLRAQENPLLWRKSPNSSHFDHCDQM